MPLKFWDEAFLAMVFLVNRTPSRVIDYQTPLEKLFGEQPEYSALRVFGCACWPNLHPFNSRKLQFRSTRCTFLGYSSLYKGYKCLDIATGRVYISRDVIFDENVFPFAELHPNAGAKLTSEILLLSKSRGITVRSPVFDAPTNHLPVQKNPTENVAGTRLESPYFMCSPASARIGADPPARSGANPGVDPAQGAAMPAANESSAAPGSTNPVAPPSPVDAGETSSPLPPSTRAATTRTTASPTAALAPDAAGESISGAGSSVATGSRASTEQAPNPQDAAPRPHTRA